LEEFTGRKKYRGRPNFLLWVALFSAYIVKHILGKGFEVLNRCCIMYEIIRVGLLKTAFQKLTAILFKSGSARPLRPSKIEESSSFLMSNFFNSCMAIFINIKNRCCKRRLS
jgi:hypothetical protein